MTLIIPHAPSSPLPGEGVGDGVETALDPAARDGPRLTVGDFAAAARARPAVDAAIARLTGARETPR